jgi:hypothetical protein
MIRLQEMKRAPTKKYPSVAEAAKKMYEQTTKDIVDCWEGRKDEKP